MAAVNDTMISAILSAVKPAVHAMAEKSKGQLDDEGFQLLKDAVARLAALEYEAVLYPARIPANFAELKMADENAIGVLAGAEFRVTILPAIMDMTIMLARAMVPIALAAI